MQFLGFNFSFLGKYWIYYVEGLKVTLQIAFFVLIFATVFGILLGLMRISKNPLGRGISSAYVNFIRGVPLLIQVYIFYYGLKLNLPEFWAAVVALTVNSSAYMGEHVRAGIQAVNRGQMEAARCLGMTKGQGMWHVIVPQAIKNILPSLCNEFILLIKNTSIVSAIALHELTYMSNSVRVMTYLSFEPLIITALIYFSVTYVLKKLVGILERRLRSSD